MKKTYVTNDAGVKDIPTYYFGNERKPDDTVTVIEGITLASRLHAAHRGVEIRTDKPVAEYRYDFDDPSILVGEFDRNEHGISFSYAKGSIEESVLIVRVFGRHDNPQVFNPQILFAGLDLKARDYNKISFRMKREYLPNADPDAPRPEIARVYFTTSLSQSFSDDKCVSVDLKAQGKDLAEWFDVELEAGEHPQWQDVITNIRFDPTTNNGVYYLDYLVLSKSEKINNTQWYDPYVDYAIENSLIALDTFKLSEYGRSITKYELLDLLIKALPEDSYPPIHPIKGIPDVSRTLMNADAYLTLYRAGIYLGDEKGCLNGTAEIKVAEAAEILCRMECPEERIQEVASFDWLTAAGDFDIEFDDEACLAGLEIEAKSATVTNGALVVTSNDGDQELRIDAKDLSIKANEFFKLRIRMKAAFEDDNREASFGFAFTTSEDEAFVDAKTFREKYVETAYIDPAGWYILEVNLCELRFWKGTVTAWRLIPSDRNGTYAIDYIRFIKRDPFFNASHEELLAQGYTSYGMLHDNGFENGFVVSHYQHKPIDRNERVWNDYVKTGKSPDWDLMALWSLHDLWDNRDQTTDAYTLTDTIGINTVVYNPEIKSLTLRLNATKVYNGEPHDCKTFSWWPHLLINQQYVTYPVDKVKNSAAADKIFVDLDMRVTDFKNTTNPNGSNSCAYLLFFYFTTDKAPGQKIWFGITLFNNVAVVDKRVPDWVPDSAARQYIFALPMAVVYDGLENSFIPEPDKVVWGDEWKHIRVDITDQISRCLEWANRDKAFGYGLKLTKEDMYFGGCNIGFEIHGNYDCTVEVKNLDITSYNRRGGQNEAPES